MEGGGGGFVFVVECECVGGFEMSVGVVFGGEIEEFEVGEKVVGLGVVIRLEICFGDFELGGVGELVVEVGVGFG